MLVIALTGGIGCGKTTVSEIFKKKGVPVIDTDIIAREIVESDKPAYIEIRKIFGDKILDEQHNINRQLLRKLIFSSPEKRKQLENILHPLIWNEVISLLSSLQSNSNKTPYCIVVVPLLFETKSSQKKLITFDRILVIDSPESLQIQRTMQRDNCDEKQVEKILASQVSRQTRLQSADDVILNNAKLDSLKKDVEKLHQFYLELSGNK